MNESELRHEDDMAAGVIRFTHYETGIESSGVTHEI